MRDRDYYPAGAYDDPNAPFNQHDPDPIDISCEVTVTLKNTLIVDTTDYTEEYDEECGSVDVTFNGGCLDLEEEVSKRYKSIPYLLGELEKYIKGELAGGVTGARKWELETLLESCRGWEQEEMEVEDYDYC